MPRERWANPCQARRRDGTRCHAYAIEGGSVCRMHGGGSPKVRDAARRRLEIDRATRRMRAEFPRYKARQLLDRIEELRRDYRRHWRRYPDLYGADEDTFVADRVRLTPGGIRALGPPAELHGARCGTPYYGIGRNPAGECHERDQRQHPGAADERIDRLRPSRPDLVTPHAAGNVSAGPAGPDEHTAGRGPRLRPGQQRRRAFMSTVEVGATRVALS
jgi:hypothetical protein